MEEPKRRTGRTIFNQIVLIFTIGCIFGTYWEEIMTLVRHLIETGELEWVSRRGLLYGPLNPVYGIGAVIMYLGFYLPKLGTLACFIGGALMGGIVEYILSLIQEMIFGTVSWNYETKFLNIGGRTTIPYMLVWGLLVLIFARFVLPHLEKLYWKVNERKMQIFCIVLTIFLVLDAGISLAATIRQSERHAGEEANGAIEEFLDTVYTDERIYLTYSNMKWVEGD